MAAELAVPVLVAILTMSQLAKLIENTLALLTKEWVACRNLAFVFKALERDLSHICVKFLSELSHLSLRHGCALSRITNAHLASARCSFVVRKIELAFKIVFVE